jgi:hypothetical protein
MMGIVEQLHFQATLPGVSKTRGESFPEIPCVRSGLCGLSPIIPEDRHRRYPLQRGDLGMQTQQLPDVLRTWPSAEAAFGGDAEI